MQRQNDMKIYEPLTDQKKAYFLRPRNKSKEIQKSTILLTHPLETFDEAPKLKSSTLIT